MTLPSFDDQWRDRQRTKPRVLVLEIRDRDKPDTPPIAWLLVEREETYRYDERDKTIYEASIRLYWETIERKHSRRMQGNQFFGGSYSRGFGGEPSVSLVSGAVFFDPAELRGQRIGTYLMNEIVTWAKQWPNATVQSVELLAGQAQEDNKDRRNRFYERFGLVFDYRDPEHREGVSKPMPAEALTPVETWRANLKELDVRDYLADVLYENERLRHEISLRMRANESLSDEISNAEKRPLRWAFRRVWWRTRPLLVQIAILIVIGAAAWSALRSM